MAMKPTPTPTATPVIILEEVELPPLPAEFKPVFEDMDGLAPLSVGKPVMSLELVRVAL